MAYYSNFGLIIIYISCSSVQQIRTENGRPEAKIKEMVKLNQRPIIGVLAQESTGSSFSKYGDTFIRATYVKFVEMAGARTVPIRIDESDDYYEKLFSQLNGVLFPGGSVSLITSGYAIAGKKLYEMAIKAYDENKEIFPLWGTCQGFELLHAMTAGEDLLIDCDAMNLTLPLNFTADYRTSRLYHNLPDDLEEIASNYAVTQNMHEYCLTSQILQNNSKLKNFYHVSSTSVDRKGVEFISSMEAYNYPFYGTQFHPEKNVFDWDATLAVNHSDGAVRLTQYYADFFVQQETLRDRAKRTKNLGSHATARKSTHRFQNIEEESKALFYNYVPLYRGEPSYWSLYLFNLSHPGTTSNEHSLSMQSPAGTAVNGNIVIAVLAIVLGAVLIITILLALLLLYKSKRPVFASYPSEKSRLAQGSNHPYQSI